MSKLDWREGFLFVGNHLCLDFINTRPELNGKFHELLGDWSSIVRWFGAAGLIDFRERTSLERKWAESNAAYKLTKAMQHFREELRKSLLVWERYARVHTGTIHELNALMSRHPMLTKIKSKQGKLTTVQWFLQQQPNDLFTPIVSAAASLFSEVNPARVRKCEHCVLHFHDTSKIGTRRWCSMGLCGNRAKVAAYAARHGKS